MPKNYSDELTPRIIVKFLDSIKLEYKDGAEKQLGDKWAEVAKLAATAALNRIYADRLGGKFGNLQALTESLIAKARARNPNYVPPNFWNYFVLEGLTADIAEPILKIVRSWSDWVQTAYLQPIATEPSSGTNPNKRRQGYLRNAPVGIGVKYAEAHGGDGTDQDFVDLERGWQLDHPDLVDRNGVRRSSLLSAPGTLVATQIPHGTNTLGVVSATDNNIGCVGITPNLRTVDVVSYGTSLADIAPAITMAAAHLLRNGPGGVLLLEVQAYDPVKFFNWPIESEEVIFNAIQLATQAGVIVIEPAGNGRLDVGQSLDAFRDSLGGRIFDRNFRDSGAIMVGAGEMVGVGADVGEAADLPAAVTWDRAAMSNFGARVDCFAWGYGVWTTDSSAVRYAGSFGKTSGASAIVAGAALALQGMAENSPLANRLSPSRARDFLSDATPNVNTPTVSPAALVGVMPNLERIGVLHLGLPAAGEVIVAGGPPGVPPGGPPPGIPPLPPP
jgi:serine protease